MGKGNKGTKSEALLAYEREMTRLISEKLFARNVTSCYKCSKADPTEIVLDQNEIRQYLNDKVDFVHDEKFNCDVLTRRRVPVLLNCGHGDKRDPGKCSTCAYSCNPLTVEYVDYKISKQKIVEMRTIYKCKKHNEQGHYYRASFSCSDYKEK